MDEHFEYELVDADTATDENGFEIPPDSFLRECAEYWANTMKPFHTTVERKIGNTTYVIETEFAGRETLADKLHRLMMGESEKT